MATQLEFIQHVHNIIHKGMVYSPDNKPLAFRGSYKGVLGDIQAAILMAHDLRGAGSREKIDRVVADLAHLMVLIQLPDVRPNRDGEMLSYVMDLLTVCCPSQ